MYTKEAYEYYKGKDFKKVATQAHDAVSALYSYVLTYTHDGQVITEDDLPELWGLITNLSNKLVDLASYENDVVILLNNDRTVEHEIHSRRANRWNEIAGILADLSRIGLEDALDKDFVNTVGDLTSTFNRVYVSIVDRI